MSNKISKLDMPYHLIDLDQLNKNLIKLQILKENTNCNILYALKAFSSYHLLKYISPYIDGICASGLYEARLGKKVLGKEVHTFSSAYKDSEICDISKVSDYVIFNSYTQWNKYYKLVKTNNATPAIRINPEFSEIKKYNINPCHKYSRFGIHINELEKIYQNNLCYIHIHNMCEQYSETFIKSNNNIIKKYQKYLNEIDILNLGGGQLFTDNNYCISDAIESINKLQNDSHLKVYLEPGEAVLLNTGYFVTHILDIVDNGMKTAILNASAVCHLPDAVYSNFRYKIKKGYCPKEKSYVYRLAGNSCYAGDIFGDYSFDKPLQVGDEIIFCNTADYTMVKSSMFNGIPLPSLVFFSKERGYEIEKVYDYETFLLTV